MEEKELRAAVERIILTELARLGEPFVPVVSSNRHCHLSQADVEALFGPGYHLTKLRGLTQPGQFACTEQVLLETPKGSMKLRVVGPARKETQVELAMTDAVKLGLRPPLRMSGELEGSPGCTLSAGGRRVALSRGVIIAARHLHLSPEEAEAYSLKDGDVVALKVEGPRPCLLENVVVRSGPAHRLEAHVDTDEANACLLQGGRLCRVIRPDDLPRGGLAGALGAALRGTPAPSASPSPAPPPPKRETMLDVSREPRRLITEDDVRQAARNGYKIIRFGKDAILTPLARDAAAEKGVELAQAL